MGSFWGVEVWAFVFFLREEVGGLLGCSLSDFRSFIFVTLFVFFSYFLFFGCFGVGRGFRGLGGGVAFVEFLGGLRRVMVFYGLWL